LNENFEQIFIGVHETTLFAFEFSFTTYLQQNFWILYKKAVITLVLNCVQNALLGGFNGAMRFIPESNVSTRFAFGEQAAFRVESFLDEH